MASKRKLNIIVVGPLFPPDIGAGSTQLYNYAKALIQRNHNVTVVTSVPHYPHGNVPQQYRRKLITKENYDGIPTIRVWMPSVKSIGMFRRLLLLTVFSINSTIAMWFIKNPDIAYGAGSISPSIFDLPIIFHCRSRGVPFVLVENDSIPETIKAISPYMHKFFHVLRRISGFVERNTTAIVTYTESIRQIILDRGTKPEKIYIVPLPVDTETFKPQPIEKSDNSMTIMYSGILGILYDFDTFLKAAEQLKEIDNIKFVIRGEGEQKEKILSTIRERFLKNVTVMGKVKDYAEVSALINRADIFLVPMKDIPVWKDVAIPTKIFEFAAMGKPIICAGGKECKQFLESNNIGYVVNTTDHQGLVEKIRELKKETVIDMGNKARSLAIKEFSLDSIGTKLETAFYEVLERKTQK